LSSDPCVALPHVGSRVLAQHPPATTLGAARLTDEPTSASQRAYDGLGAGFEVCWSGSDSVCVPADCVAAIASPRSVLRGAAHAEPGRCSGRAGVARCRRAAVAPIGAGGDEGAWPKTRDRGARHPVGRRGSRRRAQTRRAGGWLKTGTYVRDPRGRAGRNGRALASVRRPNMRPVRALHNATALSAAGSDAWARTARARHRRAGRSR